MRDCFVAYTPWYGWNFEDAIVVSSTVASEFASSHMIRYGERLDVNAGESATFLGTVGEQVPTNSDLVQIRSGSNIRRTVRSSTGGEVTRAEIVRDEVVIELRVFRPLDVGDKLTNRHGAKGVVA